MNVIGCCTTPSKPIIVFVNCLAIEILWELPEPIPVKVTTLPELIYSGLVTNWKLSLFITFANTVDGRIVVTIPAIFVVDPIDTAVADVPTKVVSGE